MRLDELTVMCQLCGITIEDPQVKPHLAHIDEWGRRASGQDAVLLLRVSPHTVACVAEIDNAAVLIELETDLPLLFRLLAANPEFKQLLQSLPIVVINSSWERLYRLHICTIEKA